MRYSIKRHQHASKVSQLIALMQNVAADCDGVEAVGQYWWARGDPNGDNAWVCRTSVRGECAGAFARAGHVLDRSRRKTHQDSRDWSTRGNKLSAEGRDLRRFSSIMKSHQLLRSVRSRAEFGELRHANTALEAV